MRLLKGSGENRDGVIAERRERDAVGGGGGIRCPRCAWEPRRDDLWGCLCGHLWNTFDTGGVCPACQREWRETQCLRCHRWSPHLDWYARDGEPPA